MTFASMISEFKSSRKSGPNCCRIHGKIYHLVSLLYPDKTDKPGYGQLKAPSERLGKQPNQSTRYGVVDYVGNM
jgi:hypothetical protein